MQLHGKSFEDTRRRGSATGRLPVKLGSWLSEQLTKKMSENGWLLRPS